MKKFFLLSFALCSMYAAHAASCVTVQQVSTNYATKQVTFDLKWGTCNNTNHLYRVWVFVDYRPVTITTKGAWSRATIAATDKGTLVSANKGVWVTGTVNTTQRVTLTLDVIGDKFDWCAFATDYPPNVSFSGNSYTFNGTPPFTLTAANGVTQQVNGKTLLASALTITPTALTDATNCPAGFCLTVYDDCSVVYACSDLPNTYNSLAIANSACAATFGAGWRMPTFAELSCAWSRIRTNGSFSHYWYITSTRHDAGYGGCYYSDSGGCTSWAYYSSPDVGYRCVRGK